MPLNVRFELGSVVARKKASPFPFPVSARPYLWTVFFKIDDADGSGNPIATVVGTPGSHGNLGVGAVAATTAIPVPPSIGRWETGLNRLPARQGTANGLVGAIVGVIAILMEEDNVSDDGAEAGHRELNKQVQEVLDGIAADLSSAINFDSGAFAADVQSKIAGAVRAQQNVLEDLWSWVDKDDFIGSMIWHARYDQFAEGPGPLTFSEDWEFAFADWSLFGFATTFTEGGPRFSRTALNFGSVRAGLTSSRSFTISNFTPQDLALTITQTGSKHFRLSTSTVDVPRARQVSIEVRFFPVGPGSETGSLVLKRQGSSNTIATISLAGSTPAGPAP
jgi:hypothetical protein